MFTQVISIGREFVQDISHTGVEGVFSSSDRPFWSLLIASKFSSQCPLSSCFLVLVLTLPSFVKVGTLSSNSALYKDLLKVCGHQWRMEMAFFDIRVIHPRAKSNANHNTLAKIYNKHERERKEIWRPLCTYRKSILLFSTTRGMCLNLNSI